MKLVQSQSTWYLAKSGDAFSGWDSVLPYTASISSADSSITYLCSFSLSISIEGFGGCSVSNTTYSGFECDAEFLISGKTYELKFTIGNVTASCSYSDSIFRTHQGIVIFPGGIYADGGSIDVTLNSLTITNPNLDNVTWQPGQIGLERMVFSDEQTELAIWVSEAWSLPAASDGDNSVWFNNTGSSRYAKLVTTDDNVVVPLDNSLNLEVNNVSYDSSQITLPGSGALINSVTGTSAPSVLPILYMIPEPAPPPTTKSWVPNVPLYSLPFKLRKFRGIK